MLACSRRSMEEELKFWDKSVEIWEGIIEDLEEVKVTAEVKVQSKAIFKRTIEERKKVMIERWEEIKTDVEVLKEGMKEILEENRENGKSLWELQNKRILRACTIELDKMLTNHTVDAEPKQVGRLRSGRWKKRNRT